MTAPNNRGADDVIGAIAILFLSVVCGLWAGAFAAAGIADQSVLRASIDDAVVATPRLIDEPSDPRSAWPQKASAQLPDAPLYWIVTAFVVIFIATTVMWVYLRLTSMRVGMRRRPRFGVAPGARLAKRRELTPLLVDSPLPGRFVFGEIDGRLAATENRQTQPTRSRLRRGPEHVGDRACLGVFGPPRSGKTATVVSGVLDWEGPAILSSVKGDMFEATVRRRQSLGRVFVFDPFFELDLDRHRGVERVGWSPLLSSTSLSGAQQAAQTLMEAAPSDGVEMGSYWMAKGKALLWPLLFAARWGGRSMSDVVRWLALQDGDDAKLDGNGLLADGEVAEILLGLAASQSGRVAAEAEAALVAFSGFWRLHDRNRSSIFSTAQTLVEAWEDPFLAASSDVAVGIELAKVLDGVNTLYMVQPLRAMRSAAVVFGGLLGDLLRDQAYSNRTRITGSDSLLAVIDEAGNTPMRWLPEVASTCAGVGVQLVTVWQSIAQIRPLYGDNTDALLANHGTLVFFAGLKDRPTCEYVAMLGGDEEVTTNSSTADLHADGRRRSIGASTTTVRLIPPDLLRQMPDGTAMVFHNTLPPAHLVGRKWWTDQRLMDLHDTTPAPAATRPATDAPVVGARPIEAVGVHRPATASAATATLQRRTDLAAKAARRFALTTDPDGNTGTVAPAPKPAAD